MVLTFGVGTCFQGVHPMPTTQNRLWRMQIQAGQVVRSETRSTSLGTNKQAQTALAMVVGKKDYNDDAFGFVFLGSLALTQDPVFATIFFTLSAAAAIATRSGQLPATKKVPAAVAGCTLVATMLLRQVASSGQSNLLGYEDLSESLPQNGAWIQAGLCVVSMVYGVVMAAREEEMSSQ